MMRASRLNPRLSAYTQLEGTFNFDATPLAPPGCKVIIHEKPKQRNSWDQHGKLGWYLGPALEHYRCYRVYCNETRGDRFSDVVEFFPSHVTMPHPSSIETATKAALDLTTALQNPSPATPFARYGDAQLRALEQLQQIFKSHIPDNLQVSPSNIPPHRLQRIPQNTK